MTVKKKKPYLPPSLPRKITKYRNVNNSSGYIPYLYTKSNILSFQKDNIIIVHEQDGSSGYEE
ncbi:MAG: hypothetical protein Q7J85_11620 [Bacillota bacterium]|nr:hypothetical protein [Bacillota bacterium]